MHPIKEGGIPTPTNTEQSSAIHPPTVVNVHHLENKAVHICVLTRKKIISYHHDFHKIIANRGGRFGVCLGGGNSFCSKYRLFFAVATSTFLSPMHSYGKRTEERSGRIGMVQDEAQSFLFGRNCLSFCIVDGGFLQWVSKSRLHHHGLSIC